METSPGECRVGGIFELLGGEGSKGRGGSGWHEDLSEEAESTQGPPISKHTTSKGTNKEKKNTPPYGPRRRRRPRWIRDCQRAELPFNDGESSLAVRAAVGASLAIQTQKSRIAERGKAGRANAHRSGCWLLEAHAHSAYPLPKRGGRSPAQRPRSWRGIRGRRGRCGCSDRGR